MLFIAQFVFASALIGAASAIVLLWLFLLTISYGGQGGLMPWVAAGVVLYGITFVAIAALVGVPGIFWSRHLARSAAPRWATLAKVPSWIGTASLFLGLVVSVAVMVREQFRPEPQISVCVSYRDAAALAAMATSRAESIPDCPVPK